VLRPGPEPARLSGGFSIGGLRPARRAGRVGRRARCGRRSNRARPCDGRHPGPRAACSIVSPGEQAELDQRGRLRVDLREPGDRLVQVDQVVGRGVGFQERLQVQLLAPASTAPLQPLAVARARSMRIRRIASTAAGQEVDAIAPGSLPRRGRPAGGTPRGPAPCPAMSGRASPGRASGRPAGAVRRTPSGKSFSAACESPSSMAERRRVTSFMAGSRRVVASRLVAEARRSRARGSRARWDEEPRLRLNRRACEEIAAPHRPSDSGQCAFRDRSRTIGSPLNRNSAPPDVVKPSAYRTRSRGRPRASGRTLTRPLVAISSAANVAIIRSEASDAAGLGVVDDATFGEEMSSRPPVTSAPCAS